MTTHYSTLNRASLDHQYLFDLCAMQAYQTDGSILIRSTSGFQGDELVRRINGMGTWDSGTGERTWLSLDTHSSPARCVPEPITQARFVVWAEPLREESADVMRQIAGALHPDGMLCVLFTRGAGAPLPQIHGTRLGSSITSMLRPCYSIIRQHSFHGPSSLFWWQAAALLERCHRPDLADRCWYKMRANFRADGWQSPFSTATVLFATPRKAGP